MTEKAPAAANLGGAAPAPRNGATMAQPAVEGKYYEDFGVGEEIASARFTSPLRAGDTVRAYWTIKEKRVSQSRPSLGVVVEECRLINQRKETVLTGEHVALVRRRPESVPV